jgi:glycosyltransferase involved in cell wall biosynthesis
MTISAIIPAYNAAETIREAIRSIYSQTLKSGEIIVVDDGSRDDTTGIVGREFPECRVICQENGGPAAARNRGVEAAKGDWIAFLDGDDAWLPPRLATQMEFAAKQPDIGLWCGEARRWAGEGIEATSPGSELLAPFRWLALADFIENNPVATSTVLMRRDLFSRLGGFDTAFRGPEDFDLWLRVAAQGDIGFVQAPLAMYRCVPGSLSMDERRFLPEALRVLDKAFAQGGALAGHAGWRPAAESTQYWNASWMAFERRDRRAALSLLAKAWRLNRRAHTPVTRSWLGLLLRYLLRR